MGLVWSQISPLYAPKSKPRNWLPTSKKGIGIRGIAGRGYNETERGQWGVNH
jgi:hypothetical protein